MNHHLHEHIENRRIGCTPKVGHQSNHWAVFMAKYDESYKLEVVQCYVQGSMGAEHRPKLRSPPSDRAMWGEGLAAACLLGLHQKFSRHSAEFNLAVLQRMWRDDLSA